VSTPAARAATKVALFMPSFRGGGAERVMLSLAAGFTEQGLGVDLLVAQREGAYLSQVPQSIHVIDLRAPRVLAALPALVRYLRREKPQAMLSALSHANVVAIWARSLARIPTRLVVSEHNAPHLWLEHATQRRARLLPALMRRTYRSADAIVAVSDGLANDLAASLCVDRSRVVRVYNPVITPQLSELAAEPLEHPWFAGGEPPVVLGAGRLTSEKDFETLIRAFAIVRRSRAARLLILGEGMKRAQLEASIERLGISADVALPGFVANPYRYMRRAAVFVLSSRSEGFGNVLVEAMACGTPVVSTDCPSGPREILEDGLHGALVPVDDPEAMATSIIAQLERPYIDSARERAQTFTLGAAVAGYRAALAV
jgi:glycosyltransferase involved in cell wall biosynthesis